MIKIKIEETNEHIHIEVKGHANYNIVGQDIVCSAISALLQTLCYSLEEAWNSLKLRLEKKLGVITINYGSSKPKLGGNYERFFRQFIFKKIY